MGQVEEPFGGSLTSPLPIRAAIMKLVRQIILPMAVLLAIVAGVTLVSHYRGKPRTRPASPAQDLPRLPATWQPDESTPDGKRLKVGPARMVLQDIRAGGGPVQAVFYCWSTAQPEFSLQAHEETGDPCFECKCKPMDLWDRLKTGLSAGQRVTVIVRDQPGSKQLDLGPFERTIVFKSAEVGSAAAQLASVVRGEVTLAGSEDRIDLGTFSAARGARTTVGLVLDQAGMLDLASRQPDYLEVQVRPLGSRERWELDMTIPAGRLPGRLPPDSVVILKVPSGRRLRIPVTGQATQ